MPRPAAAYYAHDRFGLELVVVRSSRLSYPRHSHVSTFIIGLVRSGLVCLTVQDECRRLAPGDMFVIPPYRVHELASSHPCDMVTLCLDKRLVYEGGSTPARPVVRAFAARLARDGLISENERKRLAAAAERLVRARPALRPRASGEGLEALRERLEKRPQDDIALAEMARIAHVGRFHLVRKFRHAFGLTPRRFLMQNRVRKAKAECLRHVSLTLAGLNAGYYDQSHFIRCFKSMTGMTPKQYRKAHVTLSTTPA